MNPVFKSKYDQLRESMPAEAAGDNTAATDNRDQYAEAGHIRNLCFVWPDGKMRSLSYNYLVFKEYLPQENIMILEFTTHVVRITGINLKILFQEIELQTIKRITCSDDRYNSLNTPDDILINEITIQKVL